MWKEAEAKVKRVWQACEFDQLHTVLKQRGKIRFKEHIYGRKYRDAFVKKLDDESNNDDEQLPRDTRDKLAKYAWFCAERSAEFQLRYDELDYQAEGFTDSAFTSVFQQHLYLNTCDFHVRYRTREIKLESVARQRGQDRLADVVFSPTLFTLPSSKKPPELGMNEHQNHGKTAHENNDRDKVRGSAVFSVVRYLSLWLLGLLLTCNQLFRTFGL